MLLLKNLRIILFLSLTLAFPLPRSFATTDFVSTYNLTGEDYATIATWEAAIDNAGVINSTNCRVFSHGGITGAMPDSGTVTGQTSGATGTIIHTTATQIVIDTIVSVFQSGEDVCDDSPTCANKVNLSNAGDLDIAMTLNVYDNDGAMDETFTLDGLTTDANSYWKVTAPAGERHAGKDSAWTDGLGAKLDWSVARVINNDDAFSEISWLIIDCNGNTCTSGIIDSSFEDHKFNQLVLLKNAYN